MKGLYFGEAEKMTRNRTRAEFTEHASRFVNANLEKRRALCILLIFTMGTSWIVIGRFYKKIHRLKLCVLFEESTDMSIGREWQRTTIGPFADVGILDNSHSQIPSRQNRYNHAYTAQRRRTSIIDETWWWKLLKTRRQAKLSLSKTNMKTGNIRSFWGLIGLVGN